jgi:diguanylate cyclase (GGDEF)-like protein
LVKLSDEHKDFLTGFYRRDILFEYLEEKILLKAEDPFCLLLLDIDHFKNLNDRYGHLCGDDVLRFFAAKINTACSRFYPQQSLLVRYGGDELVVILDRVNSDEASNFANKLLKEIEHGRFYYNKEEIKLSATIGIAAFPEDSLKAKTLFDKADRALYIGKKSRRKKIIVAGRKKFQFQFKFNPKPFKVAFFVLASACLLSLAGWVGIKIVFPYLKNFKFGLPGKTGVRETYIFTFQDGHTLTGQIVYSDWQKIIVLPKLEEGEAKITIRKKELKEIKKCPEN